MIAQPIEIPLAKGFYESESLTVSNRLCQNLYPNIPEIESTTRAQLFSTPGLVEMDNTGLNNFNRGAHVMADIPYFVNGNTLWRYNRTIDGLGNEIFSLVNLGVIPGEGRVSMADSGTELCVVVPGTALAYIYSDAGGFQQITDPGFIPSPIASIVNGVVFASGYFVFHADNAVVFHSQPNDGLSYNSIDFFTYENGKNEVVGLHEYKEQLYVFSDENSAVYAATNVSSNGSAFIKVQGYEFSKGLSSQFSVFDFDGSFVMIGQGVNESPKIYAFSGNDFQAISHTSIEYLLQQYNTDDISNAFGFNYTFRGAVFAVFSLPNNTFVFDAKASRLSGELLWHERRSIDLANKKRWRVNSLITAYNRLLCGDSEGGIIGEVDNDTFTEYGNKIFREVSLIIPDSNGVMKRHYYAKLEIEPGISPFEVEFDPGTSNYILASEALSKSNWTKTGVTVDFDDDANPINSEVTADKLTEDTSTGKHGVSQSFGNLIRCVKYFASVYVKPSGRNFYRVNLDSGAGADFNITTGESSLIGSAMSSDVVDLGNGWYRLWVELTATATTETINISLKDSYLGSDSYTGDGSSGALIWGAQASVMYLTDYARTQSTATNLFLRSEEIENAAWTKTRLTAVSNDTTAPDGTMTADKILDSVDNATHFIYQGQGATSEGEVYTNSIYAKAAELPAVQVRAAAGNGANPVDFVFNLNTGTVVSGSGVAEALDDGWYRLSVTRTVPAGETSSAILVYTHNGTTNSYPGTGSDGVYVWGAQVEKNELSDYIKTEGSTVTRNPTFVSTEPTPASDLNKTAEIELTYSDDGKVFQQYRARKCGERGNYFHDLQWLNLGATRTERTYKLRMSHPVKYVLRKFIVGMA